MAAYQPIGAASLAASYVNLASAGTYDAAPGTAPTFATATGWTFNGTTQYLTISPNALLGSASYSVIMRCNITAGAKRGLFNFATSPNADLIFVESDREFVRTSGSSGNLTVALTTGSDAVWAHTWGSSNAKVYKAGSESGSVAGPSAALANPGSAWIEIGRAFGSGGGTTYMLGTIAAVAIYTGKLTAGEVATLTTLMSALPVSAKGLPIIAAHYSSIFGG